MEAAHLRLGQIMEMRAENGVIVAEPVPPALEELVAGITPDNLPGEIEFGLPAGKELPL